MESLVEQAHRFDGLTAIVCTEKSRVRWLAKQLEELFAAEDVSSGTDDTVQVDGTKSKRVIHVKVSPATIPSAKGVALLDLALAKRP